MSSIQQTQGKIAVLIQALGGQTACERKLPRSGGGLGAHNQRLDEMVIEAPDVFETRLGHQGNQARNGNDIVCRTKRKGSTLALCPVLDQVQCEIVVLASWLPELPEHPLRVSLTPDTVRLECGL